MDNAFWSFAEKENNKNNNKKYFSVKYLMSVLKALTLVKVNKLRCHAYF